VLSLTVDWSFENRRKPWLGVVIRSLDARFAEMPKLQWVNLLYRANFAVYKGDFNEMQRLAELRNSMWPGVIDIEF